MLPRTIHLLATGRLTPDWVDPVASDPPEVPVFTAGSATVLRFLLTNPYTLPAAATVVDPTGLSALTLEIYKDSRCESSALLIAPAAVSLESGADSVTLAQFLAGTHRHLSISLTGDETNVDMSKALEADAPVLDAWLTLRGQLAGETCFLGAGPIRIQRNPNSGGTPAETPTLYYSRAEIDALLENAIILTADPGSEDSDGLLPATVRGVPMRVRLFQPAP